MVDGMCLVFSEAEGEVGAQVFSGPNLGGIVQIDYP